MADTHHMLRADGGRRTPRACPHCGHEGAFDGMGPFNREKACRTLDGEGKVETWERWYQIHCPECDGVFATREKTVRRHYDKTGEEHEDRRELVTDGGQPRNSGNELPTIRDALMDAEDWEYTLAGHLVGTQWVFPDYGVDEIRKVREVTEREMGERYSHPEVVLKYEGVRIPVSGFKERIDPGGIGDIEPTGTTEERIIEVFCRGE